jgi:LuxR family maltose regulon positive regulatory protein
MAALSMRDRKDVTGFIEKFSGTNRYILDYLLEEVLAGQPPEIQHFLLYTSILERLTAPLCDALMKDEAGGSSSIFQSSSTILDYLDRANLFLVPVDDKRTWYRYHHLFADLLHTRLNRVDPCLALQLHMCAAAWLEHAGMTVEAINHTLSAGEYDRAARMVEENTTRLLAQGDLNALMDWIEMLPAELRITRPWLCVHQAYALMFAGRSAEVEPLLAQAEIALRVWSAQDTGSLNGQADKADTVSMSIAEVRALRGAIAAIRAFTAAILVQAAEALSQGQQARELLTAGDLFNQCLVAWARGYALHSQGHLSEARSAFEEQIRLARAMQNNATLMIGLTALARVLADQGQIGQARALMEEALFEARQKGTRNLAFIARVEAHLAALLYEQNELEVAHQLLSDALTRARFWRNPNHVAFIDYYLVRVLLAEGDLQGARRAIEEADQLRRKAVLSDWIRRALEAEIVQVWLALQSAGMEFAASDPLAEQSSLILASWRSELAEYEKSQNVPVGQYVEMTLFTLAYVSLASGQVDETLALLERVTRSARAAGHTGATIKSLALTAVAYQGKPAGRNVPALAALEEALALAGPGGYVRVFLDEGQPMQTLLAQWLAHAGASPLRDYVIHLLSQFDAETHRESVLERVSPASQLVDPLSQRELEVLHLMALGRTNQEIAEQLIVAAGTVKAHAASIYRKLEAANRTEAVSRARQLGILP